jgi:hypothetical protein
MPRIRIARGYRRALKRHDPTTCERCNAALVKFLENPRSPGLNFESVTGMPGYYSIRASLSLRVLLRKEEDENGELVRC